MKHLVLAVMKLKLNKARWQRISWKKIFFSLIFETNMSDLLCVSTHDVCLLDPLDLEQRMKTVAGVQSVYVFLCSIWTWNCAGAYFRNTGVTHNTLCHADMTRVTLHVTRAHHITRACIQTMQLWMVVIIRTRVTPSWHLIVLTFLIPSYQLTSWLWICISICRLGKPSKKKQ